MRRHSFKKWKSSNVTILEATEIGQMDCRTNKIYENVEILQLGERIATILTNSTDGTSDNVLNAGCENLFQHKSRIETSVYFDQSKLEH